METASFYGFDCHVKFDNEAMVGVADRVLKGHGNVPEEGQYIWLRMREAHCQRKKAGGIGHAVSWIPGHTTKNDVDGEVITMADHLGNSAADFLAGKAAKKKACPTYLMAAAEERLTITKVVQTMMHEIVQARRDAVEKSVQECLRRDAEDVDLWENADLLPLPFNVQRRARLKPACKPTRVELERRQAAAMCTNPSAVWTVEHSDSDASLANTLRIPKEWHFPTCWAAPMMWYWKNLIWSCDTRGVTWIELCLDFSASTGVRFRNEEEGSLSLAVTARRFLEASQAMALCNGTTLWPGELGMATSLVAFGFPRVHGLLVRPHLTMGATVSRLLVEVGPVDLSRVKVSEFLTLLDEVTPRWHTFKELVLSRS
jgi:hypothetical protein